MGRERRRSAARRHAVLATLVIVLSVVTGCATGGKISPNSVDESTFVPKEPSVTRLEDGREGFIIRENQSMDAESRRDFERAVTMMKNRDDSEAILLLEKVIDRSQGVTAPHINIAMVYRRIDKKEKAEEHLNIALTMIPGHPVASNEYGLLLRQSGRFDEARQIYEKSLKRFPEYLPVRRNLGILCDLYLNDPACALEQYEIYSEALPEDEQIKLWLADLRLRLGK